MAENLDLARLRSLSPESRARVEESLKATLEGELARVAGGAAADLRADHSKSSSPWHSKMHGRSTRAAELVELDMLSDLRVMPDEAFTKFAERLATLRRARSGG